jgi:hypothetical protein
MMSAVEPLYHQRMAQILKLALNAPQPLELSFYYMQEYEEEDAGYALNNSVPIFSRDQHRRALKRFHRRINARCGGLLEVKHSKVEFLHRTVRDFLLTREMHDDLCHKAGDEFKVNLSALKSFLCLFRTCVESSRLPGQRDHGHHWIETLPWEED